VVALHLIKGTPPPERSRKRQAEAKASPVIQCHRCGGREVMQTRIGVRLKAGKPTGGTVALICAGCHRKGERVVLA